ncbi:hypothetical protein V8E51_014088 [Hyaloscypha variabilis]
MDASHELQSTSGEGASQPDQQFIFVTDYDRRFIRSRLVRNSWTQRNERNSQRPSLREHILPATRGIVPNHSAANSRSLPLRAEQQAATNAQVGANHADLASLLDSFGLSEVENSRNILRFQAQSNGHDKIWDEIAAVPEMEAADITTEGHYRQHYSSSVTQNAISSFEVATFDPFETCPATVRPIEHALIHHWIHVFGTMMFGSQRSSINPMTEVWIPEALSNEASFQGMLSFAAAHLGHLSGRDSGVQGTMYKLKSIAAIQNLLNNDETMLSDYAVAAVLRQISIEDRFESAEAGLDKMMEKRGGNFNGNWRLEILFHWYLLTSIPQFYLRDQNSQQKRAEAGSKDAEEHITMVKKINAVLDLSHKASKMFEFFRELRFLTTSATKQEIRQSLAPFSAENKTQSTECLLHIFRTSPVASRGPIHDTIEETCRLAALFYMAAIKADSLKFGTRDFEMLMQLISETQSAWEHSLEMLLWVLLRGNGPGLANPEVVQRLMSYMELAKYPRKKSWNAVKEILVGFLCDDAQKAFGILEESMVFVADLIRILS